MSSRGDTDDRSEAGAPEAVPVGPAGVPLRPAATVIVLRDHAEGLQAFVLQRVSTMAFAPGMTVFPGGGVDPTDHGELSWFGPDAGWWSEHLGTEAELARALVVAAARELFEESGVLLADRANGAGRDRLVGAEELARMETLRSELSAHTIGLGDVLDEFGLSLRADLLRPWANWITPPGGSHRYDTFFFVAGLPANATARLLTTEANTGRWARPLDLLAECDAGKISLLPPTSVTLADLAGFAAVDAVLDARRHLRPVVPEIVRRQDGQVGVQVAGREFILPSGPPRSARTVVQSHQP